MIAIPLNEGEVRDLKVLVMRARRIDAFLNTQIWREVEEIIAAEQDKIEKEPVWRPGNIMDADQVAMAAAFKEGRIHELGKFAKRLDRIRLDGHEAAKKLKEMGINI